MDMYVQNSIQTRADFFEKYYTVPPQVQPEVDAFLQQMYALGETCANAMEFEQKFAAGGLSQWFNGLLVRCTPKPYQMTQQEQAYAKDVRREMRKEENIGKKILDDVVDDITFRAEEEMVQQRRKQMIEDGTMDDYTRATNYMEDAQAGLGFLGRLFKKRK